MIYIINIMKFLTFILKGGSCTDTDNGIRCHAMPTPPVRV